jgi:CRP/FNR family cyclic AMP-dependent transcriptional regulator
VFSAEIFGYIASGLVLATFSMRTMIPLRIMGMLSNVSFITYAYFEDLFPVLILHAILLPLNAYRYFEVSRLVREIENAAKQPHDFHHLIPFMSKVSLSAGTTLFDKGDSADAMYILTDGRIRIPEFDADVGPGEMVGEVGMFSPGGQRLTTAICVEDCTLQRIGRERVRELVFQSPRIGFDLITVVTGRLFQDVRLLQKRLDGVLGHEQLKETYSYKKN